MIIEFHGAQEGETFGFHELTILVFSFHFEFLHLGGYLVELIKGIDLFLLFLWYARLIRQ
jgi:hypothetical protein